MKEKLLFEVIVTNQCNKRCPYCKLDFRDSYISKKVIITFCDFILNSSQDIDTLTINFFGGEPLLRFDIIENIVSRLKDIDGIQFSLGTNGLLLTNEYLDFFEKNNFKIYLSLDTETGMNVLTKDIFNRNLSLFLINFIINPHTIQASYALLEQVKKISFPVVNIMPVLSTIPWIDSDLQKLSNFINICRESNDGRLYNYYSYFNDISIEKQFILETNGNIYQDMDSLLWIQKQHREIGETLGLFIDKHTHLGNISSIGPLYSLLEKYSISKVIKLVKSIPVFQGKTQQYDKIDNIMNKPLK